MNKPTPSPAPAVPNRDIKTIVNAGLKRRHAAERRFRWYGLIAISLGLAFVVLMFANIIGKGYPAFWQTYVQVPINSILPCSTRTASAIRKRWPTPIMPRWSAPGCARCSRPCRAAWNCALSTAWSAPTRRTNCNAGCYRPRP